MFASLVQQKRILVERKMLIFTFPPNSSHHIIVFLCQLSRVKIKPSPKLAVYTSELFNWRRLAQKLVFRKAHGSHNRNKFIPFSFRH